VKIASAYANNSDHDSFQEDLETLRHSSVTFAERPCKDCRLKCVECSSTTCTCRCSPECENLPKALSSDPERYPLEHGVVALSYELNLLEGLQPCWSCEGHLDNKGNLYKIPQVWFYASTSTYARLIIHHLWQLTYQHKLNYMWQISVVDFGNSLSTTYAIRPEFECGTEARLGSLQQDLKTIAKDLAQHIKAYAVCMQTNFSST